MKTYQPPYTSLRAKESEKLRRETPTVKAPVLPEEQLITKSSWRPSQTEFKEISSTELIDIHKQMFSAERQAELELKAREGAQRAEYEKEAAENLKKWKQDEINNLDAQIEKLLADQGITKTDLQRNAKLRAQVTAWKRENTIAFKKLLLSTEQKAISESQSAFAEAQKQQRGSLKAAFAEYESGIKQDLTKAVNTYYIQKAVALKNAGFINADMFNRLTVSGLDKEKIDEIASKYAEQFTTQRNATSALVAKGTVKVSGNNIELVKPISAVSDSEWELLKKAGFNLPAERGGKRLEVNLYDFGEKYLSGSAQEATEYFSAVLGSFFDAIEAPVKLFQMLPGEQPWEKEMATSQKVTASTLQYYEDLTVGQKAAVYTGGAAATVGAALVSSYIIALPVGATSHGIKLLAQNPTIQSALSHLPQFSAVSQSQLASKIATFLAKNPKLTQALIWSPIAGIEAGNVVRKMNEGVPLEDIIGDEAIRISQMYGSLKGFQEGYKAGYKIFDPFDKVAMSRWIKMEEVYGSDGKIKLIPTIDRKYIPKDMADLIRTEIDPLTGKEVLIGFEQTTAGQMPMTREYGQFMEQLIRGKAVSTDQVLGVLKTHLGESGVKTLYARGYNVATMTPREIAIAAYKELGYGTPWFEMLAKAREPIKWTGKKSLELLGMAADEAVGKTPLELLRIKDLYNDLRAMGYDSAEASYWASQILSKSPEQIAGKMLNVIENAIDKQKIVELSLTYNAGAKSAVSALLADKGLSAKQIEEVIKISALSVDNPQAFAAAAANVSSVAVGSAVKLLSPNILIEAIPFMKVDPLVAVIRNVPAEMLGAVVAAIPAHLLSITLSNLPDADMTKVVPNISSTTLVSVLPELSREPLSNTFMALTPEQLNQVLPNLSPRQFSAMVPKLTPEALSRAIPKMSPEQFNLIMPSLTPDQIEELIPKLTPEQLNYTLEALDIPPDALLRYLQTGQVPNIKNIPPVLLKKLLAEKDKRTKKEDAKQKSRMLEVTLLYYNSSERFKIKSNSFHGAVRIALQRKHGMPERVIVKVIKND